MKILPHNADAVAHPNASRTVEPQHLNGQAPQVLAENFALSRFSHKQDNTPRPQVLAWPELCALLATHETRAAKDGPLLSPATFEGKRAKANARAVSLLFLDFDHDAHLGQVLEACDGFDAVIYSTFTHDEGTERYRAVVRLARPVEASAWPGFWQAAAERFGASTVDRSCKDASRIYYLPACPPERAHLATVQVLEGRPLDPGELRLEDVPKSTAPRPPMPKSPGPQVLAADGYAQAALEQETAKLAATVSHRNNQTNTSAFALGQLVGAGVLDTGAVEAALESACHRNGYIEKAGLAEVQRVIRKGIETGAAEPRQIPDKAASLRKRTGGSNGHHNGHRNGTATPPQVLEAAPGDFPLNEIGNGQRFAAEHGADLRFCPVWEKWVFYSGGRWQLDEHGEAERRAKATARRLAALAGREEEDDRRARLLKHALFLTKRAARETMLKDAASEPGMMLTPEQFDANPQALNLANVSLDLATFTPRSHSSGDFHTKYSPVVYDPNAECPAWRRCLVRWVPDDATRLFLQEAVGASLSGKVYEEFFVFLFGDGDNGKSTFLRVVEWLLGTYSHKTQAETLMQARDSRTANAPAPELLALKGARLVTVHEIDGKHQLNAPLVKDLTGRDAITARGLFEKRPTTFDPQFTLWMFGNGKPRITDTSGGMWRRVRLIDFGQPIPAGERDPNLGEKLRAELSGILNWALEGLARVQAHGLSLPDAVRAATEEYRAEQDPLSDFIRDCCTAGPQHTATAGDLWAAWCEWCRENGDREGSQKTLGAELTRRKCERFRAGGKKKWRGIGLLVSPRGEGDAPEGVPLVPLVPPFPEKSAIKKAHVETFREMGAQGAQGALSEEQSEEQEEVLEVNLGRA